MYLRSITIKGFKSFPDRTRLEFSDGVSVIVGPNGSGKSNVTDAVLWALGEQSPVAVRGQTMQDVIFSGGHGLPARGAAEVEVVLDNSDFEGGSDFAELSIQRRLDRSGDGEYRLNGARCRLVDVLEALSDTGLGKEMHSVVSQGRVEAVIHSRSDDRRLLIEEAAGLGKHRKRRRRAELKLTRTADNLDRALDVEREARSRLRPLKRQAEAADLHQRLERQSLEARLALARDSARGARTTLAGAEAAAASARSEREAAESRLAAVAARREAAERAFAGHARAREALSERLFAATAAVDRIDVRLERVRAGAEAAGASAARARAELERDERAERETPTDEDDRAVKDGKDGEAGEDAGRGRLQALESELEALDRARDLRSAEEIEQLELERGAAGERRSQLERTVTERRAARGRAAASLEEAQRARSDREAALGAARLEQERAVGALAAVERLARARMPAPGGAKALAEYLRVDPGFEIAAASVLGPLLRAGLAPRVADGLAMLEGAGGDGGSVLFESAAADGAVAEGPAPSAGARRLLDHVDVDPAATRTAERLLGAVWVVESLDQLPRDFSGIAVTRGGHALFGHVGELRRAPGGADERTLAEIGRRGELTAAAQRAASQVEAAEAAVGPVSAQAADAQSALEAAGSELRAATQELDEVMEQLRRLEGTIERRRRGSEEGPQEVRRAQVLGELRVERRIAERERRERAERRRRAKELQRSILRHEAIAASSNLAAPVLAAAMEAVSAHREALRGRLAQDEALGAQTGAALRRCAHEEAEIQATLRRASETVTATEVRAQRARDAATEAGTEIADLARALGLETGARGGETAPDTERPAAGALGEVERTELEAAALTQAERTELEARIERLARRREQLGPVNPLARDEYETAIAHVEELEAGRSDLESALAELRSVIRETDRQIHEDFERTFAATARNFEDVVEHLFPGGRGRLRLVHPDRPRPVIGGAAANEDGEAAADAAEARAEGEEGGSPAAPEPAAGEPGVEVEVTPAGKSTRRLSLLSGGEKSLVALAFLFAVFLARPCPFYVLDEVEAALDDLNIDRFLNLVRRCADRAQFIVVTHQKRTMDVADRLYGVSMGGDGASKVVSRRLTAMAGEERSQADEPHAA